MSIYVQSLGELNLSKGFFDFTWLETTAFKPAASVHETPTWLDLDIFGDTGARNALALSLIEADTPVGPTAPPLFDAPDIADGPLVEACAAVFPDPPLEEVRWTDPFFDADLWPGGESRTEQVVLPMPASGVWMTNPWGGVDYGFEMVYVINNEDY